MFINLNNIIQFYDELSAALTEREQGTITDFELYSFMVELHRCIAILIN